MRIVGIDSSLADDFGRSIINALAVVITVVTVTIVGGFPFLLAIIVIGYLCYNGV